nr:MAG TPA: hypothetical protein [Caudoviricetes sp.]
MKFFTSAFIINWTSCTIFDRLCHIININLITKNVSYDAMFVYNIINMSQNILKLNDFKGRIYKTKCPTF